MSNLTDATTITLDSATKHVGFDNDTSGYSVSRWTEKGDRLYIEGPAKYAKHSVYLDLETHELHSDPKQHSATVTIDADGTATIVLHDDRKDRDLATLVLTTDLETDTDDEDGEDDESEVVTDGGVDSPVTDADIEAAIESHDATDSLSVADVRDLLAVVQADCEELWTERLHDIEHGDAEVVADTGDVVVLSTGEDALYDRILSELADDLTDVAYDEIASDVVSAAIHNAAERLSDYNWGYSYPLVIAKADGVSDGEDYVAAVVNGLMRRGLSPGQAWAYYGVEFRGESRNAWSKRCGYSDHSATSEALRKAKSKLP